MLIVLNDTFKSFVVAGKNGEPIRIDEGSLEVVND